MICQANSLPFIRTTSENVVFLDFGSLVLSIHRAALEAGRADWPYADQVAQAVLSYLAEHYEETVMPVERLDEAVRSVLTKVGCDDIAGRFFFKPAQAMIDLRDLLHEAGPNLELVFFQKLKSAVKQALIQKAENMHIRGIRECVKRMTGSKVWRKSCTRLQREILEFVQVSVVRSGVRKIDLVIS